MERPDNSDAVERGPMVHSPSRADGIVNKMGANAGGAPASRPTGETLPPAALRSGSRLRRLVMPMIVVMALAGALIGLHFWYNDAFYVSTDNARITGALVQVGALNAGRIDAVMVDVGSRVERDQLVATITLPSVQGLAQGTPRMGFGSTGDLRAEVRSPIDGVVVARQGNVGDTVAAGQPILAVTDPSAQWVLANVEETRVGRLQRGQTVDVHVDALGQTFTGQVETITPATAATFSLLPQQNGSGNFTKVTQLVPVKIVVDNPGHALPLGGSAEVRIHVSEPDGWLSWLR
ncbi:MAG: efflux RND transporter periplasmic adaptor subunit [Chloroflexi bacterium]|nr:efflux RND transporter periplasmic adaptor subunit [Chloroflexota bacterium]